MECYGSTRVYMSTDANELQLLLNICDSYSKNGRWSIIFLSANLWFSVTVGSITLIFYLIIVLLPILIIINILGLNLIIIIIKFNFFIKKFQSVSNSFFSLNSFGFRPGGINPRLQACVYKSFCLSRLLYGFEILITT
jgi:hypothetical protein